jgi:hypothetical protein
MKHWAFQYIGANYFDVGMCWGQVQICCRERFGEEMPSARDERSIRLAVHRGGWRRVPVAQADDIVVAMGPVGRHVGFVTDDGSGTMGVLHAYGTPLRGGEVRFDTWPEFIGRGFHSLEYWRHATRNGHS